MALTPCAKCGYRVGGPDRFCAGCGEPVTRTPIVTPFRAWLFVTGVCGAAILGWLAGPSTSPESPRATAACELVSRNLVDRITETLTVTGEGALGKTMAVRSRAHERVWFVATEIQAPGLDNAVGVFATNQLDGSGFLYAVGGVATDFSSASDGTRTDARFSLRDPGASDAERCVLR